MSTSRLLRLSVPAVGALGLAIAAMSPAPAQDVVKLKMHLYLPSTVAILGTSGPIFAETATKLSNNTLVITPFEPGKLVPAFNYGDALREGSIKLASGTPGLHAGKVQALVFFTAVPFGPGRIGEYYGWLDHGGGKELLNEIYAGLGMRALHPCFTSPPETSGWFKKEMKSIDDMAGMKFRIFGFGAKVLAKFGVSTQMIAGADIYPSLERGVIDASEYSSPVTDEALGLYEIAKHNYFPGWHQQTTLQSIDFHAPTYDKLSDYHKLVLDAACSHTNRVSLGEMDALQPPALKRMSDKGAVTHRWSDEDIAKLRARWDEVVAEESAADPMFKKVYDSYHNFRESHKIWGELAYIQ
jgi:TRAP-type mannitol/chloroaromatic compound transport system substrate-binding protein